MTVLQYFEDLLRSQLPTGADGCGELARVSVVLRGSNEEVDVDSLADECHVYLQLGLSKVFFYVEQASEHGSTSLYTHKASAFDCLVREPNLTLPTWMHAGRPALTKLFADLRARGTVC